MWQISKKLKWLGTTGVITVITIVLFLVISEQNSESAESCTTGQICITSLRDGDVVMTGQTIIIDIEPASEIVLQDAYAVFWPKNLSIPEVDTTYPFQVSVTVPNDKVGPATLKAYAKDQNGNNLETSINLIIDTNEVPQTLNIYPDMLMLSKVGETDEIGVSGYFINGETINLTVSPQVSYDSTNLKVATINKVDGHAIVEAVGLGTANIIVIYGTFKKIIPVKIGVSPVKGDLDLDYDVDRDDIAIINAARNTPATGSDDPRDLDNDGLITGLDARKLVLLCSRPRCATQ